MEHLVKASARVFQPMEGPKRAVDSLHARPKSPCVHALFPKGILLALVSFDIGSFLNEPFCQKTISGCDEVSLRSPYFSSAVQYTTT